MNKYLWLLILLTPIASSAATSYEIEMADNDEKFIINGEVFEAQTYCLGWEE
jgi:hypothetical protein